MQHQPDIQIDYYDPFPQNGFSFSSTAYTRYHFPKHFHNHYTIILIEQGVNEGFSEKNTYRVRKGGVLIINPGDLHAGNSFQHQYLQFKSLRIDESLLRRIGERSGFAPKGDIYFRNSPIYDPRLVHTMQTLLTHIQPNASLNELQAVQTHLLLYLIQNYSNQHSPSAFFSAIQSVKKARDFIHENYQEDFSLQDIAQYSHLSPYHLIRQFKKQYGLSPFQYLRNYRIEKAKELLKKPSSITEIALEVGFFDLFSAKVMPASAFFYSR